VSGRPGRAARGWLVAAGVGLALLGVGAAANGTLSYSQSPGDLAAHREVGQQVRLSGTVEPGSLVEDGGRATFVLTGGGGRTEVRSGPVPGGTFREGAEAVVEGRVSADGALDAAVVIAGHGNTYRAADDAGGGGR
jgi:cytochrome c-type biogenesis protein CcmE